MKKILLLITTFMLLGLPIGFAASLSAAIGSYDTDVYVNSDFTVSVSITSNNVTGNVGVTIAPKDGLSCKTPSNCQRTLSFTTSGSQETSFILTADETGSYTSPFTISASSSSTSASPVTASSTISVTEQPSWTLTFTTNNLETREVSAGQSIDLDLQIDVTDSISGVSADLSLPSGWSLTAGTDPYNIGTITATQTLQWTVKANDPGKDDTLTAQVTATDPVKSDEPYIKSGTNPTSGTTTTTTTTTISTTTTTSGGGDGGAGGGGGGGAPPTTLAKAKQATKKLKLVPGKGLKENTKLQQAMEKVLAKGKMSDQAKQNLLTLSKTITSDIEATRDFKSEAGKSTLKLKMKYKGKKKAKNFMVHDSVPKAFAQSTDNITVTASGADVEIVEKDPEYLFTYPEVSPGQDLAVSYEVDGEKDTSVMDETSTEFYAESLQEVSVEETTTTTIITGETTTTVSKEKAEAAGIQPWIIVAIVIVIIIAGAGYYFSSHNK